MTTKSRQCTGVVEKVGWAEKEKIKTAHKIVGSQYLIRRRMDIFSDYKANGGDKDNPTENGQDNSPPVCCRTLGTGRQNLRRRDGGI